MNRFFTLLLAASCLTAVGQIEGDLTGDGCVQLDDLLELLGAFGTCGGDEPSWQCGDPYQYEGYDYETIQIGQQCWFAENLRTSKYSNGDNVAMAINPSQWHEMADIGMTTWYHDFESTPTTYSVCSDFSFYDEFDAEEMREIFGNFYNQSAVDDERGICPSGWHVPSAYEWEAVSAAGELSLASSDGSSVQWCSGLGGNGAGLNLKPGGWAKSMGTMFFNEYAGINAFFWTTTEISDYEGWEMATGRILVTRGYWNYPFVPPSVVFQTADYASGLSIRCIKD